MRFVLKLDKNDEYKTADIKDLTAVEALVLHSALLRYTNYESVHEEDKGIAWQIINAIEEGSKHPSRPLEAIDGAELPVTDCQWK